MYQSEAMQNEHRKRDAKRDKENYQQQAFRDANQWRSFLDDISHEVMFLSQITGEIRAGLPDALSWVVQVRVHFVFSILCLLLARVCCRRETIFVSLKSFVSQNHSV